MERWHLNSLQSSTEKRTPREPGADAPRIPRHDGQIPRVLFSSPECRAVVVELSAGEALGDHQVRERAVVQVVDGSVSIEASGESLDCEPGSLVMFAPGERHSVRATEHSVLLLILAPWPAREHYAVSEPTHAQQLPANASAPPSSETR